MTSHSDPNPSESSQPDVDALFAELTSSMPDLASIEEATTNDRLELVEVVVPHPLGTGAPMRLAIEVPPEIAPAVRAEFSPERVAAMTQAINALVSLSLPPQP